MMKKISLLNLISIYFFILLSFNGSISFAAESASSVAAQIGVEVAKNVLHSKKDTGRAIIVIDEIHNSRVAQLQEAILLEKLYNDYGARELVLEGYLTEDKDINTMWFEKATENNLIRRAKVAIHLLCEGEINAGEYWKLVHSQVKIIAAETKEEHEFNADIKAHAAPETFLMKIAGQSAEKVLQRDSSNLEEFNKLSRKLKTALKEFEIIKDKAEEHELNSKREETKKAYDEYKDFIIKLDPWCGKIWENFKTIELNSENPSLEKSIRIAETIKAKARETGLTISPEENEAMSEYIAFMQARHKGTLKIASMIKKLCSSDGPPIVVIIGIGHSLDLSNQLDLINCSYAFLRPLVLVENKEKAVDIPFEMFIRKYKGLSIYSEGPLSQALESLNELSHKKPKVVLNEPWLIGKAEIYSFIDRITDGIFGTIPPDQPPRIPPKWDDGSFRGEFVFINPKNIQIIANDHEVYVITDDTLKKLKQKGISSFLLSKIEKLKDRYFFDEINLLKQVAILVGDEAMKDLKSPLLQAIEKRSHAAALIPLVFNQGTSQEFSIWAKATQAQSHVSSEERQAIESMLKDALDTTSRNKALPKSADGNFGRVQIGIDTVAAFGSTSEVRKASLTTR